MRTFLCLCLFVGVALGANPNYSYHVKVDDPAHANFQEKAETRKGPDAVGYYSVVDPNGSLRTVEYTADDRGFNPTVTYSHAGAHVYHQSGGYSSGGYSSVGTYAPAYVTDNRVQIVDKFTGPPPALVQPFALPSPSLQSVARAPVVVPAPLRAAPAPELVAHAEGVEYAPAYMPHLTAFAVPAPQQVVYEAPQPVAYHAPPAQVGVYHHHQVTHVAKPVVQVQNTYLPPPPPQPQNTYLPPVEPVRTYLPPQQPAVLAVQKPSLFVTTPKKVIIESVDKVPLTLFKEDSYAVPPRNTVTDPNAPVYADPVIKVVEKPKNTYGPPNFTPGRPLATVEPVAVVKKPVQVHVSVHAAPKVVQKVVAPQPQVLVQPQVQHVQYAQQYAVPVVQKVQHTYLPPAPVVQKVVATPNLGLYAGAVGYHTSNVAPNAYLHSYGTQGFQVHSSRNFNKAVLPVPQYVQQQVAVPVQKVQHTYLPPPPQYAVPAPQVQVQEVQHTYAPAYLPPPPPQVAHVQEVQHYAPAYLPPAPQVAVAPQHTYLPPPPPQPQPVYGAPAPLAVATAAAVPVKKKNPLTFAYSYDQGGAKVSHSYSGSGW